MEKDRTYLLLFGLLITANYYIGLSLTEINFLGNEAVIESPELINYFIIIIWIYFLYRFTQHFYNDNTVKDPFEALKERFHSNILKSAENSSKAPKKDINLSIKYSIKEGLLKHQFRIFRRPEDGGHDEWYHEGYFTLKFSTLFPGYVRTMFYWILKDKSFSEYILPYIVSLIALIHIFLDSSKHL